MARRKFTREFKVSSVKLVNEQGYAIPQAGKSLGLDSRLVRHWVSTLSTQPAMAPKGEGALAAENQRLRKENTQLLMEREISKKAAAFFARAKKQGRDSFVSNRKP
jgi:transposase